VVLSEGMSERISPDIHQLLEDHDWLIPNLEGTFRPALPAELPNGVRHDEDLSFFPPEKTVFCLANNHVGDDGAEGLAQTLSLLDTHGFRYWGVQGVYQTRLENIEIFCFGWDRIGCETNEEIGITSLEEEALILESLRASDASHKIVLLHWGYEFEHLPLPAHREFAHRLVDAGASLIVGHHPHCIQGFEMVGGVPIFYSLGNFYFEQREYGHHRVRYPAVCNHQLLISVECDDEGGLTATPIPLFYESDKNRLVQPQGKDKTDADDLLAQMSIPISGDTSAYRQKYRKNRTRKTLPTFEGQPGETRHRLAGLALSGRIALVQLAIKLGLKKGYRHRK